MALTGPYQTISSQDYLVILKGEQTVFAFGMDIEWLRDENLWKGRHHTDTVKSGGRGG
jgi:enoyl-CoA hydratase/carnithine racemase